MNAEYSTHMDWFKSSYSDNEGGACIEVATRPDTVHVRDSKNVHGPQLAFPPHQWSTFLAYTVVP